MAVDTLQSALRLFVDHWSELWFVLTNFALSRPPPFRPLCLVSRFDADPKQVVTGATGRVGSLAVRRLLELYPKVLVRAVVNDFAKGSRLLKEEKDTYGIKLEVSELSQRETAGFACFSGRKKLRVGDESNCLFFLPCVSSCGTCFADRFSASFQCQFSSVSLFPCFDMSDNICRFWRAARGSQSCGGSVGRRLLRLWLCAEPVSHPEVCARSPLVTVVVVAVVLFFVVRSPS